MDAKTLKLAAKLGDLNLAQTLVEAGLDTPAKIRAAKDKDVLALKGIGKAALDKIRAAF